MENEEKKPLLSKKEKLKLFFGIILGGIIFIGIYLIPKKDDSNNEIDNEFSSEIQSRDNEIEELREKLKIEASKKRKLKLEILETRKDGKIINGSKNGNNGKSGKNDKEEGKTQEIESIEPIEEIEE